MSLPNKLTVARLALSPVLFVVFFFPSWTGSLASASTILCWIIFLSVELTDMLDGYFARARDQISDLGKVLDPFADVLSRLTYFICFTGFGIMPIWVLAVLVYREVAITFLRTFLYRRGVAMAANRWGKAKAATYTAAGAAGFIVVTVDRLDLFPGFLRGLALASEAVFILAALTAVGSFMTYLVSAVRSERAAR